MWHPLVLNKLEVNIMIDNNRWKDNVTYWRIASALWILSIANEVVLYGTSKKWTEKKTKNKKFIHKLQWRSEAKCVCAPYRINWSSVVGKGIATSHAYTCHKQEYRIFLLHLAIYWSGVNMSTQSFQLFNYFPAKIYCPDQTKGQSQFMRWQHNEPLRVKKTNTLECISFVPIQKVRAVWWSGHAQFTRSSYKRFIIYFFYFVQSLGDRNSKLYRLF